MPRNITYAGPVSSQAHHFVARLLLTPACSCFYEAYIAALSVIHYNVTCFIVIEYYWKKLLSCLFFGIL